jgi:hypothetical protein
VATRPTHYYRSAVAGGRAEWHHTAAIGSLRWPQWAAAVECRPIRSVVGDLGAALITIGGVTIGVVSIGAAIAGDLGAAIVTGSSVAVVSNFGAAVIAIGAVIAGDRCTAIVTLSAVSEAAISPALIPSVDGAAVIAGIVMAGRSTVAVISGERDAVIAAGPISAFFIFTFTVIFVFTCTTFTLTFTLTFTFTFTFTFIFTFTGGLGSDLGAALVLAAAIIIIIIIIIIAVARRAVTTDGDRAVSARGACRAARRAGRLRPFRRLRCLGDDVYQTGRDSDRSPVARSRRASRRAVDVGR